MMRITRKKANSMRKAVAEAKEYLKLLTAYNDAVAKLGVDESTLVAVHVGHDTIRAEFEIPIEGKPEAPPSSENTSRKS